MNKKSINTKRLLKYSLLCGGFIIFLATTDPNRLPLPLLFVPFVWLFVCLYIALKYILGTISRRYRGLPHSKQTSIVFLLAIVPVCMVLLKSIDQLTIRDSLILLALVGFGTFYASRLRLA